jgi:hypothetical protein
MSGYLSERYSLDKGSALYADNYGRYLYARKISTEYSVEMNLSVRKAIMNWKI